jgi:hypothetical protein
MAFACGVEEVAMRPEKVVKAGGHVEQVEVVDMSVPTPLARKVAEAVTQAEYFDDQRCHVAIRQARSLIGHASFREITQPFGEPAADLEQELWQFSHITSGLCVRTVLATLLLSYGMIQNQLLLIIAGLLFIPLLPLVLAVAFAVLRRHFDLLGGALAAFLLVTASITVTSFIFGALSDTPIRFASEHSFIASTLLSLAVGLAAAFGTVDDAGRREMLGLAAASQLALLPCWLGLSFGTSMSVPDKELAGRLASIFINPLVLAFAAAVGYAVLGYRRRAVPKDDQEAAPAADAFGAQSHVTSRRV